MHSCLLSRKWDARISAGVAIEAVCGAVPPWEAESAAPAVVPPVGEEEADGRLRFGNFEMRRVLQHGTQLLGSTGFEYDIDLDELAKQPPRERLRRQRLLLNEQLGLDDKERELGGMEGLVDTGDLEAVSRPAKRPKPPCGWANWEEGGCFGAVQRGGGCGCGDWARPCPPEGAGGGGRAKGAHHRHAKV